MALKKIKPTTPGQRFEVKNTQKLWKGRPEKSLTKSVHRKKGRNCYGRITSRRRGGGHKRLYRMIDFKREKLDMMGVVERIEYDPNRTANIALIKYEDGEKRYILAPRKLEIGETIISLSGPTEDYKPGLALQLKYIPAATSIHCIEMQPGRGARIARSAGQSAQLISVDGNRATVKMPSGEMRMLHSDCRAVLGRVGNEEHESTVIGKAGRNRWKGRRPRVRGVAMNPVDHPMGGGEAKTSGGGHPVSPWGQLSKGFPTRIKSKTSNNMILVRRNGRKMKRK